MSSNPNFPRRISFLPSQPDGDTTRPKDIQNIDKQKILAYTALYRSAGVSLFDDAIGIDDIEALGGNSFDDEGNLTSTARTRLQRLPSSTQLGIRNQNINLGRTRIDITSESNYTNWIPEGEEELSVAATLNHPEMHYGGPKSSGMIVIATTTAATLIAAGAIFAPILALFESDRGQNRRFAGNQDFLNTSRSAIKRQLGFPDTEFSLSECVSIGIPQLVGFNPVGGLQAFGENLSSGNIIGALQSGFERVGPALQSPGFYATVNRGVVNDLVNIREVFSGLNGTALTQIRTVVDELRKSSVIRFLAVAAILGDIELRKKRQISLPSGDFDKHNNLINGRGYKTRVGRQKSFRSRAAISLRDTHAVYKAPPNIRDEIKKYSNIASKVHSGLDETEQSKDIIKAIEKEIDKEYIPFWIQDMRTGEVVSFHGFLETINDTFSPSIIATPTSGRVDDVLSYGKTTRTLSCSFKLVATSIEDHDYLWWLINWLTMLIYPQWSDGVKINSGGGGEADEETSPFGRIMTASPLIRIGLGEVWRSNATDKNIKNLLSPDKDNDINITNNVLDLYRKSLNEDDLNEGEQYILRPNPNGYSIREDLLPNKEGNIGEAFRRTAERVGTRFGSAIGLNLPEPPKRVYIDDPHIVSHRGFLGNVAWGSVYKVNENMEITGPPIANIFYKPSDVVKIKIDNATNKRGFAQELFSAAEELTLGLIPIPLSQGIRVTRNITNNAINRVRTLNSTEENSDISFKKTPFYQSLKNNATSGLAGMVEGFNLNYDWVGSRFGIETTPGSRAPIGVDIELTIKVIHDIAPGRNSKGINRAPLYNVGSSSRALAGLPTRAYGMQSEETPDDSNKILDTIVGDDNNELDDE